MSFLLILQHIVAVLVLTQSGQPIRGAWVEVEGMYKSPFYEEQTTDSRGKFFVIVDEGPHEITVTKEGYRTFAGVLTQDMTVYLEEEYKQ